MHKLCANRHSDRHHLLGHGSTLGASYSYRVEAIDIEGNVSPFSNVASCDHPVRPQPSLTCKGNYATPQTSQTTVTVRSRRAGCRRSQRRSGGMERQHGHSQSSHRQSGNAYTLAVGPTTIAGFASQSIYYAKNIAAAAAGANTVTVTFSGCRGVSRHSHPRVQRCGSQQPSGCNGRRQRQQRHQQQRLRDHYQRDRSCFSAPTWFKPRPARAAASPAAC